ncbi:hypothetical protein DL762_003711 [Monosporascus cannonballus]|uniref:C2H2-type domain-containing protein n=1 Tax=Monosporascus cannonballus TaxID=155416 RepID=A0ABY0H9S5_9PEZI|nr:hypothetical protein DL762_003711 [Monosporascus cannonballus]
MWPNLQVFKTSQHKRYHIKNFVCREEPCLRKADHFGFSTKRDLTRHQEQVHNRKKTQCPYCSSSVKRQDNLGRHIAKVHGNELSVAAAGGNEAIVRLVLDKEADIESKDGKYGRTLLSLAAANGREAVVKLLLDRGADIETKDRGGAGPLSLAGTNGHEAVVKLLLDEGADIETKDYWSKTPLSLAAENGHEAVVKLLLDKGADIGSKDYENRTPLSLAVKNGHDAVVNLLQAEIK